MSESPRIVLFEGRGGQMRCGEFVEFLPGDRIKVLTDPEGVVKFTSIKEAKKRSPAQVCANHNWLLARVDELERENERLRGFMGRTNLHYTNLGRRNLLKEYDRMKKGGHLDAMLGTNFVK